MDWEGNGSYCVVLQVDHQVRQQLLGQLFRSVNAIWCQAIVIAKDGDYHKSGLLGHLEIKAV